MPENRPHAPVPVSEKWPNTLGGFMASFGKRMGIRQDREGLPIHVGK